MSIEQQAIAGLKWTGMTKLVSQALSWVITLIVVRLLAPEDYGLMAITSVIISILASVAELGLGASIVQVASLERHTLAKVAGVVILLNLAIGVVVLLCAPVAAVVFDDARLTALVQVSSLNFLLSAFSTIPQSLAYRDMNFKWLAWIELFSGLLTNVSTLGLAWFGAGVWALVAGNLLGGGLRTVLLSLGGHWVRPIFGVAGIREHLGFGGALTVGRLAWQVINQLDILIAGRVLAQDAVGVYSVSLHLATLPMQKIMSVVNQVAFPTVARLQTELPRLRGRLLEASRILTFVSVPLLWGLSSIAPEFVNIILGDKWQAAVYPLQIIGLTIPLRMLSAVLWTAATALGQAKLYLLNTALAAAILSAAFLVGVQWGVDGLASSWLVTVPCVFAVNFPRLSKALGITFGAVVASVYAPLTAGAAMFGAVAMTRSLTSSLDDLQRSAVLILVGAATYLALIAVLDRRVWVDFKRLMSALKA
jgi:O-antigen/teichoic acid export membrane protein